MPFHLPPQPGNAEPLQIPWRGIIPAVETASTKEEGGSRCHPHIKAGRRVEEGGKGRRRARWGQESPQLTGTGGESPLVSGRWRKNWIKTCCHIPDGMYAKMIQIK